MRTPGDEDRIARIKENGLECLGRLHGDQTWEDWMGITAAMEIITEEALDAVNATRWDKDNKAAVKEFNRRWEEYESGAGKNYKPLSKQERWAVREVMTNPEITAYRSTLTGPEKRRLNHPNAVINRWRAREKAKAVPAKDKPLSHQAKQKLANIELQEELHRIKKRGDGNAFTKDEKIEDIANAIIGTFDGMPTKLSRVESVARAMLGWVKAQKKAKPAG
jgi:hypothetical protein